MDRHFHVPGTRIGVGLDAIIGLIPGIGDAATLVPATYIISKAADLGVPRGTLLKMAANVGIDFVIGLVPIVGDLLDVAYRANAKNVRLIEQHVGSAARVIDVAGQPGSGGAVPPP